ncbi:myosin-13-like [Colossoma macropomum]|uniref:myosin-13-like n=1 Tax=Colossoma macropomum TaxID=42526 RepID=UPI0018641D67|nr:myosin-13-like [Colossoma macropomum]
MEPSSDIEAQHLESVIEEKRVELRSSEIIHEPDSGIISVQLLEFKTRLLEAVEELHIHRDSEVRYEAQICKLVLEKQELEWQKESLQSQVDRMSKEHSESLAAVKKQFQAQVRGIEGEKGKHQLSAELKDKEITSLKEELKLLQLFKYSLEKKLSELEQKLQLQTQVKDRHLNQLGEVEKRFEAVTRQCAMVKQAHGKLEQNVEEAVRLNKKLASINKKQESTIAALKKDVERLNGEMVKCKVASIHRSGEESSNCLLREQQIQELQQRLIVEKELNKKLRNENAVELAEKQKLMSSLQHAQWLLQTQTQAVCRTEQQLLTHTEEYQVLKREHEMSQERSKEKEDSLMQVIEEYKNSRLTLEKEVVLQNSKMQADQEELRAVKEAYDNLHEKHQQLSSNAMHQAKIIHGLENGLEDSFTIQKDSSRSINYDVHLTTASNLNERTAECQETAKDGCFHGESGEVNVYSQTDQSVLVPPSSQGLDALAPNQSERSENISGANVFVTNTDIDLVVKQATSVIKNAPVRGTFDSGCPSSVVQSYTDSCLTKLSEHKTRSVYRVASDPLMSESRDRPEEQSLGVSEMREHQTSDKHTSETSQAADKKEVEPQTTAPGTNSPLSVLPNDSELHTEGPKLPEESDTNSLLQEKDVFKSQMKHKQLDAANSSPPQQIVPQPAASPHKKALPLAATVLDTTFRQSNDQVSQLQESPWSRSGMYQEALEDISKNAEKTNSKSIPEAELNTCASHLSLSSPSTVDIIGNLAEDPGGNEREDNRIAGSSAKIVRDQQKADAFPSPLISNLQEDALSSDRLTKQGHHLNDMEMQINDTEPFYLDDNNRFRSFDQRMSQKETLNTRLKCSQSVAGVLPVESKNNSSASSSPIISEQKSVLPSGFQELCTTLSTPLFSRHNLRNRGASVITQPLDKLNVSNILPDQKTNHHEEWNAIKQTFSEISVEKENRVPISFGSAQLGSPVARSVGNGLKHDCTPTLPPRLHSLGKVSRPVSEGSTPTLLVKEDHNQSDIRAQIAKIDQFLASEGFRPQKRRRVEKSEVSELSKH